MKDLYSHYLSERKKQNKLVNKILRLTISSIIAFVVLDLLVSILSFIYFYNEINSPKAPPPPRLSFSRHVKNVTDVTDVTDVKLLIFYFFFILGMMPSVFVAYKIWRVNKQYKLATELTGLEEMPAKFARPLSERINQIRSGMPVEYQQNLSNCLIKYFLERRNFSSTPFMTASSNTLNLIFPLGFFKIFKASPETADAIIAHELGHFFHKDCNKLIVVKSILKSGAVLNIFFGLGVLLIPQIGLILIIPAIIYGKYINNLIYKTIWRSEELADLFAAIVVNPGSMKAFLSEMSEIPFKLDFMKTSSRLGEAFKAASVWSQFDNDLSLYPTIKKRIKLLEYYEKTFKLSS